VNPPRGDRTADYSFELPQRLIAQHPHASRESSRLLVLRRDSGTIDHRSFADLVDLVSPGDVMVVNDTRVFPARLRGVRPGGGAAEVLLLRPLSEDSLRWLALVRPGAKLKPGRSIQIAPDLSVEIEETTEGGERVVLLRTDSAPLEAIERHGEVPLPPYIRRPADAEDRERYQTVYAKTPGSVAAPTAGLHFTPDLISRIEAAGVRFVSLVLHVGIGTFRPVESDDPAEHRMHSEWYRVSEEAAAEINRTRSGGGALWAVGTTTVRTLEHLAGDDGRVHPGEGWTDIFIRPPYDFKVVDRLITNFHLPRSTLMMLVSAFGGYDLVMAAYREAIDGEYRFFSYGDAMVIT